MIARIIGLVVCFASAAASLNAEEIVLGMSAAFTGPSRGLSIELYRGSQACFAEINKAGGIHGRTIRIVPYDDAYSPKRAIDNTIKLVEEDKAFLLFDYMGSPTVARVLPLLKKYEDRSTLLFFPFSGAEPQRSDPYRSFVFNLRASYLEETAKLVDRFVSVGRKKIAVFYQVDAYGRSGWDGVRKQLQKHGLEIAAEATYARGAKFTENFAPHVSLLRKSNPDGVILIGTYEACAGFIREARNAGWTDIPMANISGVDSENLLERLIEAGKATGKDYTGNLINSQIVPSYQDRSLKVVQEYRRLMDVHQPVPPSHLLDAPYTAPKYSFISLEGFLNAKLMAELLQRLGPDPKAERIREVMEKIRDFDLGIDVPVTFTKTQHQGLNRVYCTVVESGQFVPLADDAWERWRK